MHSREVRRDEGGDQSPDVDGEDGDDDARQEDGCQLVDVLHAHKHQQGHEQEADGAVHPHVVEEGRALTLRRAGDEDGRLRSDVHLQGEREKEENEFRVGPRGVFALRTASLESKCVLYSFVCFFPSYFLRLGGLELVTH